MGTVGNDDTGTLGVATQQVVLAHHHESGELAMCTGKGCQGEVGQAGELAQCACRMVVDGQRTLHALLILQGVQTAEGGVVGYLFVDLGVVLHGAAAQGVEACFHTEVLVRHVGVVAHHIQFAHLGELGRSLAKQSFGN